MPEQFLALTRAGKLPVAAPSAASVAAPPQPVMTPTPVPAAAMGATPPPVAAGAPVEPSGIRRSLLIGGIVAGVVLIGGGIAAFFVLRSVPTKPKVVSPTPQAPPPVVNVAPVVLPPVNTPPPPVNIPPPPPPPPADRDSDGDGLTDAEEVLLGTDVQGSDTDGDGYEDRIELLNLYNPIGIAPQRLIDAGVVFAYEHPTDGWEIYIPKQWSVSATDQEQLRVQVETGTAGEQIDVQRHANPDRLPLSEAAARLWPAASVIDVQDVQVSTNKRGTAFARLADDPYRVAVAVGSDQIIFLTHGASPPARYSGLFAMIVQSIHVSGSR